MTISSRTPEGSPNRCPVCQGEVRIESSLSFGDAPCPNCGCLLWFLGLESEDRLLFEYEAAEAIRERIREFFVQELGVNREALDADPSIILKEFDSLDMAELIMELEEEFKSGTFDGGD